MTLKTVLLIFFPLKLTHYKHLFSFHLRKQFSNSVVLFKPLTNGNFRSINRFCLQTSTDMRQHSSTLLLTLQAPQAVVCHNIFSLYRLFRATHKNLFLLNQFCNRGCFSPSLIFWLTIASLQKNYYSLKKI